MIISPINSPRKHSFELVLATLAIFALAGCGAGPKAGVANVDSIGPLNGLVHGGPNSIVGAAVTLYATQSNGYGGQGLPLATTTTDGDGTFSFNPSSYTCPSGQQAYVVIVGGNTGGNIDNANSMLIAAIGSCSSLNSNTFIWVDELTTVAAAYALGNFISIDGNTVNISAPANNNAATGSCSGTGTSMSCVAAGLSHAFLNAQTLINGVGSTSALPTGAVNSNPPQNSGSTALITALGASSAPTGANPYTLGNTIPVPVINSLGNILQACVNSTGGTSGDGSSCGNLFLYSTPSSTYSTSTTAPTNTLQAIMNIARYPFVNVSNIYSLSTATSHYQPSLSVVPNDWSISIQYHSVNVASTVKPIGAPFNIVLDANDNLYVSANSTGTSPTGSGAVPVLVTQLSSNGIGNWQTSLTSSTVCATNLTGNLCNEAVDASGNVYLADSGYLYQLTPSGTATRFSLVLDANTTLKPVNVAVDRYNTLYVASNNTTGTANLATYPAGSTTSAPSAVTANGVAQLLSPIPGGLGFDSNGDLGITLYGAASMFSVFLPNIGTTSTVFDTAQRGTLSATSTDTQMEGVIFDASNNFYTVNLTRMFELPAGSYSGTATNISVPSSGQMRVGAIDGGGTIWIPDPNSTGGAIHSYYSNLPTPSLAVFTGCLPWGSSATVATNATVGTTSTASTLCNPAVWNGTSTQQTPPRGSRNIVIDSSGAMWIGAGNNFSIVQILGVAAPTWPLLAYSKFGVQPQ